MSPVRILSRSARHGRIAAVALAIALVVTGCSTDATSKSPSDASPTEVSPNGDIPDNQAFIPYTPASGTYTVTVPEGWSQSSTGEATTFTDKLNAAKFEEMSSATAPTIQSAKSAVVPQLEMDHPGFALTDVAAVTRAGGSGVLLRYEQDAAVNDVTESVGKEAVEEYLFWKAGTLVTITLTSPVGADNVDPWRQITDSFSWR
jgi:hypothetical protein